MLQMLEAGGLPVLVDTERPADVHNPRGYFEYAPVKALGRDSGWISEARGRAIKVIHALRDVGIILVPMLGVLLFVIFFPDAILALPRWLMPRFVN